MEIKVLSSGCANCRAQVHIVEQAVEQLGLRASVVRVEDMAEILSYQTLSLPSIVIDGRVRHSGRTLSIEEVKTLLSTP